MGITPERVKELKKFVTEIDGNAAISLNARGRLKVADLLAILNDYRITKAKLKAIQCQYRPDLEYEAKVELYTKLESEYYTLKAELEKARPLLEAAVDLCENRITYNIRLQDAALEYRKGNP
jgi:autotransporter translocation and assembly factor TamB